MKKFLLFISILAITGCTSKEEFILFNKASSQKNIELNNIQFEYKIRPHDRVSVTVYKHPELGTAGINSLQEERGILVNSHGDVRLPLIRKIHLAGLTQTEAEVALINAFATYLKEPDVQMEVLDKKAYVIGEVKNPGEFKLVNEQITLLQLLAKAGDLTNAANRQSILIMKPMGENRVKTRIINLTDVNSLRTANLMIRPNDIVYVTPNNIRAFNNNIDEISPIVNLISNALTPFLTIKLLTD